MIWLIFYNDENGTPRVLRETNHNWYSIGNLALDLELDKRWSVTRIEQLKQVLNHAKEA
jgi:hypothetical protein